MNSYNIYSPERRMFWKVNGNGYTKVQSEAGLYSEGEAREICHEHNVTDMYIQAGSDPLKAQANPDPVWIHVESYRDVPEGNWLVKVETKNDRNEYHVMESHPKISIIGNQFAFDIGRVLAYKSLGELLP